MNNEYECRYLFEEKPEPWKYITAYINERQIQGIKHVNYKSQRQSKSFIHMTDKQFSEYINNIKQ